MKRLTTEEIEAIRNRVEKATEGPWAHANSIVCTMYEATEVADVSCGENPSEDAEFIMNARTDIPKLLAEVEALRKENGEYKEALSQIAHGDTRTAYPHDIAAWALGIKIEGVND